MKEKAQRRLQHTHRYATWRKIGKFGAAFSWKKGRELEVVSCLKAIRVTVKDAYIVSRSQCELMRERNIRKNAFESKIANAKIRRGMGEGERETLRFPVPAGGCFDKSM